jgi:ubiquinone/menaquinone biosynthesis C-methylase UbiE
VGSANARDIDERIAEIYDQIETQTHDVGDVRRLLGGGRNLRMLEPFCGNGRILIPMASDGHEIVGIDQSTIMLDGARAKLPSLSKSVQRRITLIQADVTKEAWLADLGLVKL